jgi:hypothetical protein
MHAYNVMLDWEAATTFLLQGSKSPAFFVTEKPAQDEFKIAEAQAALATAKLDQVQKELRLPPSTPAKIEADLEPELPIIEQPVSEPPQPPPVAEEPKPLAAIEPPAISEAESEAMRNGSAKLSATVDPEEIERRKAIFQKRKEELAAQHRAQCREQIDLNLQKHEHPVPEPQVTVTKRLRVARHCHLRDRAVFERQFKIERRSAEDNRRKIPAAGWFLKGPSSRTCVSQCRATRRQSRRSAGIEIIESGRRFRIHMRSNRQN